MSINRTNMLKIAEEYDIDADMTTREIADLLWDEYQANALLYATYIKNFLNS